VLPLALIAAVADNGVIGRGNDLPWRLPGDLAHFKRTTLGKPIVMGRRTFESIGRPLPGRSNIVVSRDASRRAAGCYCAASVAAALVLAEDLARRDGGDEVVAIGDARIYAAALPLAARLYLTEVHAAPPGDVHFPVVDWAAWQEVSRERHHAGAGDDHDYSFVVYERR